jgi:hypothetical protein
MATIVGGLEEHFYKSFATSGKPRKCLGQDVANLIHFYFEKWRKKTLRVTKFS